MAFGAKQIHPEDLNTRRALGVNLPFNGSAVFTPNYLTKDSIKNNLVNYLLTNPGERISNPEFGAGLRQYIFTQLENDDTEYLQQDLQEKISQNFDNIVIEDLSIDVFPDTNVLRVKLSYSIPNTDINDELELSFS